MVEVVSVTLGPKIRNVVLEKKCGSPQVINNGVTIAREIELPDNIKNTGVLLIRQAAAKTNDVAGDRKTTVTLLAYIIIREGIKNLTSVANFIFLKISMGNVVQFFNCKYQYVFRSSRGFNDNFSSCCYFFRK
jgi:chaperonin GroEL